MQRVYDGIASLLLRPIAGREEDEDVAVRGGAFEVPLQSGAVDLDMLHGDGPGAGDRRRHVRLDLCEAWDRTGQPGQDEYGHDGRETHQLSPLWLTGRATR